MTLRIPTEVGTLNRGLAVVSYRFDRTSGQRFLAGDPLNFIFGLFADVRVSVLERTREVIGSRVATDVAVDT